VADQPVTAGEDGQWMALALTEAARSLDEGEVPVGAVLVLNSVPVAADHNRREQLRDPTAHAELLVLRQAAAALGGWRLTGATLYVTLEPCAMCAGALVLARVARLVYGADDPKAGAVRSLYRLCDDPRLNHRVAVTGGVEADASAQLLRNFFRVRRG
jgi:tRNA(adenine34) deaminase